MLAGCFTDQRLRPPPPLDAFMLARPLLLAARSCLPLAPSPPKASPALEPWPRRDAEAASRENDRVSAELVGREEGSYPRSPPRSKLLCFGCRATAAAGPLLRSMPPAPLVRDARSAARLEELARPAFGRFAATWP